MLLCLPRTKSHKKVDNLSRPLVNFKTFESGRFDCRLYLNRYQHIVTCHLPGKNLPNNGLSDGYGLKRNKAMRACLPRFFSCQLIYNVCVLWKSLEGQEGYCTSLSSLFCLSGIALTKHHILEGYEDPSSRL